MRPLLSIAVPTKNRYYYLKFLVHYFHSIDSDQIELIIQDNSDTKSNPEFLFFLNEINDHRIKYFYSSLELSQGENCDEAILNAGGEYITLLGDDDIFSKHLIEFIQVCKNKSVDAILPNKGTYTWPDVKPRFYKNKLSGIYRVTQFTGKVKKNDTKTLLAKVIKIGGTSILNLPRVYHGIIKKSILEKIFNESGSYFPGPSPDMANAIALCKDDINYISIDIPYIISGHSVASAGGQGSQGQHFGEISKIKQLPKNTDSNWCESVPFYWSGGTIYAESVIQALKRTNRIDLLKKFNYEYLIANCFVFDTNFKDRINKVNTKQKLLFRLKVNYYVVWIWLNRISFHLINNLSLLIPVLNFKKTQLFKKDNILEVALLNDEIIKKYYNSKSD